MQQEAPIRFQNAAYGFEGNGQIIDVFQDVDAEYCIKRISAQSIRVFRTSQVIDTTSAQAHGSSFRAEFVAITSFCAFLDEGLCSRQIGVRADFIDDCTTNIVLSRKIGSHLTLERRRLVTHFSEPSARSIYPGCGAKACSFGHITICLPVGARGVQ